MPELVALAGGENLFGVAGAHSPWLEWTDLRDSDPDFIVIVPCGYDIATTREQLAPLLRQPGWSQLRAVRERCVILADGNQYFNRPGPRLADSLEILAEILHPQVFPPRYRGQGWQPL